MRAARRVDVTTCDADTFMPVLVVFTLGVLILLDGMLGLAFNESIPPLFKVMLGPMCIFLVLLLILTRHKKRNDYR